MPNNNYDKEIEKYERWRKRASNRLPELATRVFALRNKFYTGCGFHWGMERTLGYLILKMNDFDEVREWCEENIEEFTSERLERVIKAVKEEIE